MATLNTEQDIARWVDEGGAGPDPDELEPAAAWRGPVLSWVFGCAVFACAAWLAFYRLRRT